MGVKSKYEYWLSEEGLTKISGWARDGLTDEEIAKKCQVSARTFAGWKTRFPQLGAILKQGKDYVDRKVEQSLLKRALGFSYEEKTYGKDGTLTKCVTKMVVPDTTAIIFWLKNRKPEEWRDKQEILKTDDNDQVMAFIEAMRAYDQTK